MDNRLMLLCVVLVPCIGAFILPLAGRISAGLRNLLALALALIPLLLVIALLPVVVSAGPQNFTANINNIFNFTLYADGLAVFMALVSAFISAIIIFYSFGYISHYENQNEYYLMVLLFLGGMMGLIFAGNLVFLYLFWEITAITSWRLIGFFREKQHVIKADKAFLVTMFGSLLMLIGFVIVYQQTGSFDLQTIKETLGASHLSNLAVILMLAGIFSKSATLPFHTWLPDAGVAPSPVTALLHAALLVKIGVYVFARLFIATFTIDDSWHTIVPVVAGASALVSAAAAMVDTDLKRIIAYSTVSQIGFIFLGLSIGNEIGITGGLLYIMMHGLAKGGLFLCAGIVEQNTKTKDITKLGGLIKTMPITAIAFLFCSFSVMGIPPFGGFFSKFMVMTSTIKAGDMWIMLTFLIGAIMTIIYLLRVFSMVFLGEPKTTPVREGSATMVISVASLAVLSIIAGFAIAWPTQFVMAAIQHLPGVIR
ncbi:MAG: NADH-quinone oxidoreductase subunit L [Sedimentisphaerales bacterium]|jgi:proton-translocating NADH-quinone oxidoreductase chain N